jgi:hypothetical protein
LKDPSRKTIAPVGVEVTESAESVFSSPSVIVVGVVVGVVVGTTVGIVGDDCPILRNQVGFTDRECG